MKICKPKWVKDINNQDTQISFEWNEEVAYGFAEKAPGKISKILEGLNPFCSLAVALFSVEWLYWNWSKTRSDCEDVLNFVEALWVAMVDSVYFVTPEDIDWTEKGFSETGFDAFIKNKLFFVFSDSLYQGEVLNAERLVKVVRYALKDNEDFDQALIEYLKRLEKVFVWNEGDPRRCVPRDFGSMNEEDMNQTEKRIKNIQDFLELVKASHNPYLANENQLKDNGFEGEPYVLHVN